MAIGEIGVATAPTWPVLMGARTLADRESAATVRRLHVAEALSYRRIAPLRE